jgi:hypothetical protein
MKNKIARWISIFLLTFTMTLGTTTTAEAQCPMCRMSAESNLKNGGSSGKGLNAGILYMLATPYLIVGGVAYVWWRNRRKDEDEEAEIVA